MALLVTGADGYIGWPLLLRLARQFPHEDVIGVDHGGRRQWISEVGSDSFLPIASVEARIEAAHALGFSHLQLLHRDLTSRAEVYDLIRDLTPRVVFHLAAQPSAPYSQLSADHAAFTQRNNTDITRNLLWAIHELRPQTHLVITTTTGIYGAPDLPISEGWLEIDTPAGKKAKLPWPPMATSWYHMSRGQDALNLWLAHFQWSLSITEVRTAIVVGPQTTETALEPTLNTRCDADYYFGVVPHRFAAQAVLGEPLTIFGAGKQEKPFISLEDTITSLAAAAALPVDGQLRIFNQYEEAVTINALAEKVQDAAKKFGIDVRLQHTANPRIEREEHRLAMSNRAFVQHLLPQSRQSVTEALSETLRAFAQQRERVVALQQTLLPLSERNATTTS